MQERLGEVLRLLTTSETSLSSMRNGAGALRRVVDHGEDDGLTFLLFYHEQVRGPSRADVWRW
jgi:hypothetical protein